MFSLENELQKRLDIIAGKEALEEEKTLLEEKLEVVNAKLNQYDYEELAEEVVEIKRLMGIDEEVVDEQPTEEIVEG